MILIRPHHLLCIHNFVGKGYDKAFIKNMHSVVRRVKEGECIKLVVEKDAICSKCPNMHSSLCRWEKNVRRMDYRTLSLLHLPLNKSFNLKKLSSLLRTLLKKVVRVCRGCVWLHVCARWQRH